MSFWGGLLKRLPKKVAARRASPRGDCLATIDRLTAQLSWFVHERHGDAAVLHFTDPIAGARKLYIRPVENGDAVFATPSFMVFASPPRAADEFILARNARLVIGRWSACEVEGRSLFYLTHRASLGRMSAIAFHDVCEALVREALYVDVRLRAASEGP